MCFFIKGPFTRVVSFVCITVDRNFVSPAVILVLPPCGLKKYPQDGSSGESNLLLPTGFRWTYAIFALKDQRIITGHISVT